MSSLSKKCLSCGKELNSGDTFWYCFDCSWDNKDNIYDSNHQQGWICPKCNKVYAPYIQECTSCNSNNNEYIITCGSSSGA